MSECMLCRAEAQELLPTKENPNRHFICKICGEYNVSIPAIHMLQDDRYKFKKHIISSEIFWNNNSEQSKILITTNYLTLIPYEERDKLLNKAFYLSKYLFEETRNKGLGNEIDNIPIQCCYAKNKNEKSAILDYLRSLDIVSFNSCEQYADNKVICRIIENIRMTAKSYIAFEKGISSINQFEQTFIGKNMDNSNVSIKNVINNEHGNVAIGNNNIQVNSTSGITESDIIKNLLNNGIPIDEIDKIRKEITQLTEEWNKEQIEKEKYEKIFSSIKNIGGTAVLAAIKLFSRPEIVAIIDNIIH
jgi:hypothetical protein